MKRRMTKKTTILFPACLHLSDTAGNMCTAAHWHLPSLWVTLQCVHQHMYPFMCPCWCLYIRSPTTSVVPNSPSDAPLQLLTHLKLQKYHLWPQTKDRAANMETIGRRGKMCFLWLVGKRLLVTDWLPKPNHPDRETGQWPSGNSGSLWKKLTKSWRMVSDSHQMKLVIKRFTVETVAAHLQLKSVAQKVCTVCKHLPTSCSKCEKYDINRKQKMFTFKIKVVPFETCRVQRGGTSLTTLQVSTLRGRRRFLCKHKPQANCGWTEQSATNQSEAFGALCNLFRLATASHF